MKHVWCGRFGPSLGSGLDVSDPLARVGGFLMGSHGRCGAWDRVDASRFRAPAVSAPEPQHGLETWPFMAPGVPKAN